MSLEINDNFLTSEEYSQLNDFIKSGSFPWFYRPCKVEDNDNIPQLTHTFYDNCEPRMYYKHLYPLLLKMNIRSIIRIKANTTFAYENNLKTKAHVDLGSLSMIGRKTSIFYMDTTNGSTFFPELNEKVECLENRLITFDSSCFHGAILHTGEFLSRRVVINLNYF